MVLECLSLFSTNFPRIVPEGRDAFVKLVVTGLCEAIHIHLKAHVKDDRADIIIALLGVLQEWVLLIPPKLLSEVDFELHLFAVVELAFMSEGTLTIAPAPRKEDRNTRRPSIQSKVEPKTTIQGVAREILIFLLHHFNNFPVVDASERMER